MTHSIDSDEIMIEEVKNEIATYNIYPMKKIN